MRKSCFFIRPVCMPKSRFLHVIYFLCVGICGTTLFAVCVKNRPGLSSDGFVVFVLDVQFGNGSEAVIFETATCLQAEVTCLVRFVETNLLPSISGSKRGCFYRLLFA